MKRNSVLVCEDDKIIRDFLCCGLTALGFAVDGFRTADEAMENSEIDLIRYDIVITDFEMPGTKGDVFANWMRTLNPASQIFVVSGTFRPDDHFRNRNIEFLKKPFSLHLLLYRISEFESASFAGNERNVSVVGSKS